ncbi:MAG TPA: KTSC domain-containing protein [Polyangiaceae bacterium]|nr:KTSC domain-containing protein [Polyangiaceae bacterium]
MKRDRVRSSSIASVGYDEAHHVLEIEFHNGKVYRYLDVPAAVHRLLLQAPSIGEFVNTIVKPTFAVIRTE